jgi:hypothetical protein
VYTAVHEEMNCIKDGKDLKGANKKWDSLKNYYMYVADSMCTHLVTTLENKKYERVEHAEYRSTHLIKEGTHHIDLT